MSGVWFVWTLVLIVLIVVGVGAIIGMAARLIMAERHGVHMPPEYVWEPPVPKPLRVLRYDTQFHAGDLARRYRHDPLLRVWLEMPSLTLNGATYARLQAIRTPPGRAQ